MTNTEKAILSYLFEAKIASGFPDQIAYQPDANSSWNSLWAGGWIELVPTGEKFVGMTLSQKGHDLMA